MIFGVGVDMVRIARIGSAIERFGDRFARRILSADEMRGYTQRREWRRPAFLAKRFAAKEAYLKALGTGLARGVRWHDLQVRHDPLGRPYLESSGRLEELRRELGAGEAHLSLSDEAEYAIAFVTLLRAGSIETG